MVRRDWKENPVIRAALTLLGVLLALTGAVWTLQGADLVGGSFMSGQKLWLVIGLVCLAVGIVLLALARQARKA
jgi:hypothetical protein